jgi:hypothetical protein
VPELRKSVSNRWWQARILRIADKFKADVERTFRAAAKHRDLKAKIKSRLPKNPENLATKIVTLVPEQKHARVAI